MKKIIIIVAVALILTMLVSGVFSGCDAKNSASAANAGKNSSKKIDMTIARLEHLKDKDFRFPSAFGNDFFASENNNKQTNDSDLLVSAQANCCPPGVDCAPEASSVNNCPPGVDCAPNARYVNQQGYKAKHFGNRQINHQGASRTKFLDKFDDLYVLCADISAANAKCQEKVTAINEENRELKQLSKEMRKSNVKGKENFAKFNYCNRELNGSVTKLSRDRNHIKSKVNGTKNRSNSIDVEGMTMRNLMILNTVENRLSLLEDTHTKLLKTNDSMRMAMGKPVGAPESKQQTNKQSPVKNPAPNDDTRFVKPLPKILNPKNLQLPQRNLNNRPKNKLFDFSEYQKQQIDEYYNQQHKQQLDNCNNEQRQQPLDNYNNEQRQKPAEENFIPQETSAQPKRIQRFRTLPYTTAS